jgi:hypothetical protein
VVGDGNGGTAVGTVVVRVRGWQNPLNPLDVDKDNNGQPTPNDALLIINRLNLPTGQRVQALDGLLPLAPLFPNSLPDYFFFDVSGDGYLTAIDALIVINAYNAIHGNGEGESDVVLAVAAVGVSQPGLQINGTATSPPTTLASSSAPARSVNWIPSLANASNSGFRNHAQRNRRRRFRSLAAIKRRQLFFEFLNLLVREI